MKKKLPTPQRLPSGSWRVQVKRNGRRISVVEDDPGLAQAKALAIRDGLIEEEERRKAMTLEEAIQAYIDRREAVLSPSTIRGYRQMKENRFKGIMQRDIYTLTKRDLQAAVNQECRLVSAKTVANAYGLVRPVLKEYDIDVFGVKLPQRTRKKKAYIQPEEISRLIMTARLDPYEPAILLALWLGMRRSEICGLCWDCVDEKEKTITVRRTLVMNKDNHFILREGAKNISSQRTIPCPDYIMDKLTALRNGRTEGRVFRINPNTLLQHIHKVCATAGITDTTTHGLRHTNAAVMRHLGISDAHAMERGGWSEEATYKNIYSYVFDSTAKNEDARIDAFFTGKL